jgi:hypothetical protein
VTEEDRSALLEQVLARIAVLSDDELDALIRVIDILEQTKLEPPPPCDCVGKKSRPNRVIAAVTGSCSVRSFGRSRAVGRTWRASSRSYTV